MPEDSAVSADSTKTLRDRYLESEHPYSHLTAKELCTFLAETGILWRTAPESDYRVTSTGNPRSTNRHSEYPGGNTTAPEITNILVPRIRMTDSGPGTQYFLRRCGRPGNKDKFDMGYSVCHSDLTQDNETSLLGRETTRLKNFELQKDASYKSLRESVTGYRPDKKQVILIQPIALNRKEHMLASGYWASLSEITQGRTRTGAPISAFTQQVVCEVEESCQATGSSAGGIVEEKKGSDGTNGIADDAGGLGKKLRHV